MLAIPIFDGMAAVVRRRLSGKAVYAPDRGHIHHCLLRRGWSNRQILMGVGALCATTGFAVLLGLYFRSEPLALLATAAVVIGCVVTKLFGSYEYMLLVETPRTKWKAIQGGLQLNSSRVLQVCTRLREAATIEDIWSGLRTAAEELHWGGLHVLCASPGPKSRGSKIEDGGLKLEGAGSRVEASQANDLRSSILHPQPSFFVLDPLSSIFDPQSSIFDPQSSIWQLALPLIQDGICLGQLRVWGRSDVGSILPNLIGVSMVAEALTEIAKTLVGWVESSEPTAIPEGLHFRVSSEDSTHPTGSPPASRRKSA
jgi:hypothetical protein